jgi:hypothetical protein
MTDFRNMFQDNSEQEKMPHSNPDRKEQQRLTMAQIEYLRDFYSRLKQKGSKQSANIAQDGTVKQLIYAAAISGQEMVIFEPSEEDDQVCLQIGDDYETIEKSQFWRPRLSAENGFKKQLSDLTDTKDKSVPTDEAEMTRWRERMLSRVELALKTKAIELLDNGSRFRFNQIRTEICLLTQKGRLVLTDSNTNSESELFSESIEELYHNGNSLFVNKAQRKTEMITRLNELLPQRELAGQLQLPPLKTLFDERNVARDELQDLGFFHASAKQWVSKYDAGLPVSKLQGLTTAEKEEKVEAVRTAMEKYEDAAERLNIAHAALEHKNLFRKAVFLGYIKRKEKETNAQE